MLRGPGFAALPSTRLAPVEAVLLADACPAGGRARGEAPPEPSSRVRQSTTLTPILSISSGWALTPTPRGDFAQPRAVLAGTDWVNQTSTPPTAKRRARTCSFAPPNRAPARRRDRPAQSREDAMEACLAWPKRCCVRITAADKRNATPWRRVVANRGRQHGVPFPWWEYGRDLSAAAARRRRRKPIAPLRAQQM
jgi:hypothetical protein